MRELLDIFDMRFPKDGFRRTGFWLLLGFLGFVVFAVFLSEWSGGQ